MTESDNNEISIADRRQALADAFDQEIDPLAKYADVFEEISSESVDGQIPVDPFDLYLEKKFNNGNYSQKYVGNIERRIDQWKAFMDDRHPACPSQEHVRAFATYCKEERENTPSVIKKKLETLSRVHEFFQEEPSCPHTTDFNPFNLVLEELDFSGDDPKDPPPIELRKLRDIIADLTHIRDRAIVVIQLKLGIRATELCNIKLADIHIANSELQAHYPEMGTSDILADRENAIYIPHHRRGNKSHRPRVLPLDDESRRILLQYLLCRPTVDEPWLFLSKKQAKQLDRDNVNEIWRKHFQERHGYTETDRYRSVSSHFGRHYFTTWWRVEHDLNRSHVKYMRGDKQSGGEVDRSRDAIDSYINTYYDDIETEYRNLIYKFRI